MSAFDIARGWRVQRFGRKGPHEILDAIVEPLWDGPRVFVAVERGEAAVFHEGSRLNGPPDIVAQLAQAAAAGTALVAEGCLTQQALRNGEGAMLDSGEGTPSMRTRMFGTMGGGKRDALLREKEEQQRLEQRDAQVVSGAAGPLAFVATDLLWLDGDELLEVPLLERKRILESVLGEAELVRRIRVHPTQRDRLDPGLAVPGLPDARLQIGQRPLSPGRGERWLGGRAGPRLEHADHHRTALKPARNAAVTPAHPRSGRRALVGGTVGWCPRRP